MNKFIKGLLICCPIFIILGLVMCVGGMLAGGSTNFSVSFADGFVDYSKEENVAESLEYQALETFSEIEVDADLMKVTIQEGDGYGLSYKAPKRGGYVDWKVENEKLSFTQKGSSGNFGFNFSNWSFNVNMDFIDGLRDGNFFVNIGENEGGELVVSVPAGADFEKVNVVADCGKVVIALSGNVEELFVDVALGDIDISGMESAGSIKVDADCGSVELRELSGHSGELIVDCGDVKINQVTFTGEVTIENDLGTTGIQNSGFREVEAQVDCGDFEAEGISVEESLKVENDLGDITVITQEGVENYSYECETDLGDVTIDGRNCGEKDNHSAGAGAWLKLINDCGDIEVE